MRWTVERHDNRDGSIAYEVWAGGYKHRICRMVDDDNPAAKRDAEHIVKLHNSALEMSAAFGPLIDVQRGSEGR